MSHVHYAPYPSVERGLGHIPWIATRRGGSIKAHLFYYEAMVWGRKRLHGARIFTTRRRRNINPKVLWVTPAAGAGATIGIRGRRLDGTGSFAATYPAAGPDYPSYVEVPQGRLLARDRDERPADRQRRLRRRRLRARSTRRPVSGSAVRSGSCPRGFRSAGGGG